RTDDGPAGGSVLGQTRLKTANPKRIGRFQMQLPVTSRLAKARFSLYVDVNVNVIIKTREFAHV
ncbi:MAG: hypothetical protein AAFX32_16075, partial [Pseudomonadota bacterium]